MDLIWKSAPTPAVKLWRHGSSLRAQLNAAAKRWVEGEGWSSLVQGLVTQLARRCEGAAEVVEGTLDAGEADWPAALRYVSVPMSQAAWLIWLQPQAAGGFRLAPAGAPAGGEPVPEPGDVDRLRRAVELAGISVWSIEPGGRLMRLDAQGARLFGLPGGTEEVELDALRGLVHPDDLQPLHDADEEARRSGRTVDRVARYRLGGQAGAAGEGGRTEDAAFRPMLTRRVAERDDAGPTGHLVGVHLDISELEAERARVREFARRLEMVAEATGVGIWSRGPDEHAPMEWSRQMFAIYGLDPERGAPSFAEWWDTYVLEAEREGLRRRIEASDQRREPTLALQFRVRRVDGEIRWVDSRSLRDHPPRAMRRLGLQFDITERRRAETAHEMAQEQARLAIETLGIGVWSRDMLDDTPYWNDQMYRLRGYDPASAPPIAEVARQVEDPADRAVLDRLLAAHIADGTPYDHEMRVRWPDGTRRWLTTRGQVARDADGRPLRFYGVNWDITLQKETEALLRERQAAEQNARARSAFLGRMSHELRTPLNAVLGYTQLLAEDPSELPSPRQRQRLLQLHAAGRQLLELVDDVLDIATADAGAPPPVAEPVDLELAVREALEWVAPLAEQTRITIVQHAIAGTALADRRRVRQILTHLLSSVLKHGVAGGSIEVAAVHDGEAACGVMVSDDGPGLDAAALAAPEGGVLADPGIVMVRQIAAGLHGRLEVQSEPGIGTSFCVWLPAAEPDTIDTLPMSLPTPLSDEAARGLRVLCIEDNLVNLLLVQELFALRPAMQLTTAATGQEGIALARRERPDLVLLDMQLPDMHGMDVYRTLRAEPELEGTRYIALSANAMAEDIDAALGAGFTDYWTKPIDFPKFLAGLDQLAAEVDQGASRALAQDPSLPFV